MNYELRAGADIAIHFDADGQHDWRQIDRLLAPILEGSADVVFGSRFLRKTDAASTFPEARAASRRHSCFLAVNRSQAFGHT